MPVAELEQMGSRARERALEFPWSRFVERMDEHATELATLKNPNRGRVKALEANT
jgi:hypothetical protein